MRQVQEYFAQYLYLPRLTYQELIVEAGRDGVASPTWRSDTFAYAGDYDAATKRYQGLQAGRSGVAVVADGRSVIVRPSVAAAQSDREAAVTSGGGSSPEGVRGEESSTAGTGSGNSGGGTGGSGTGSHGAGNGGGGGTLPLPPTKLTRFHGSISVEPTKLATEANRIAAEVLQHLLSKLGAEVEVVIDIHAHLPEGADDQTQRTVTENCRTLHFDIGAGFEP